MAEQPKALEAALAVVNDNLIRYAQASLDRAARPASSSRSRPPPRA